MLPILKIIDTANSVTKVTTAKDEKKFKEAVEAKLAITAALDMRIAVAVKADRESRQQAAKQSPTADTSGQLFPCYCWTHGPSMSHNSKQCARKDVGNKNDATEKRKLDSRVEPRVSFKKKKPNKDMSS